MQHLFLATCNRSGMRLANWGAVDITLEVMAIQLRPLTEEQFLETFSSPMRDVTSSAEEVVDIWEYVEAVLAEDFQGRDTREWNAAYVYSDGANAWQHVLIGTDVPDAFIVVVVEMATNSILGHHFLNLRQKYGLTQ
ncbi:hypothetical protein LRS03_26080 [Rhizobacter sp. J219]|uniref:hypothetical protein n=1 Tax=Rhizobacter sp. J219 TaxID=2898430 RepID=UPI002151A84F|nr:hypothetical protein [Rhizobacter sp. J219]MCR5886135.1 hypothetical protein [Rhizobacter sp. J219]